MRNPFLTKGTKARLLPPSCKLFASSNTNMKRKTMNGAETRKLILKSLLLTWRHFLSYDLSPSLSEISRLSPGGRFLFHSRFGSITRIPIQPTCIQLEDLSFELARPLKWSAAQRKELLGFTSKCFAILAGAVMTKLFNCSNRTTITEDLENVRQSSCSGFGVSSTIG